MKEEPINGRGLDILKKEGLISESEVEDKMHPISNLLAQKLIEKRAEIEKSLALVCPKDKCAEEAQKMVGGVDDIIALLRKWENEIFPEGNPFLQDFHQLFTMFVAYYLLTPFSVSHTQVFLKEAAEKVRTMSSKELAEFGIRQALKSRGMFQD